MSSSIVYRIRSSIGLLKVVLKPQDYDCCVGVTVSNLQVALSKQHSISVSSPAKLTLEISGERLEETRLISSYPAITRDSIINLEVKLEKIIIEKSMIDDNGAYVAAGSIVVKALEPVEEAVLPADINLAAELVSSAASNPSTEVVPKKPIPPLENVISLIDDEDESAKLSSSKRCLDSVKAFSSKDSPVRDAIPVRRMRLVDDSPVASSSSSGIQRQVSTPTAQALRQAGMSDYEINQAILAQSSFVLPAPPAPLRSQLSDDTRRVLEAAGLSEFEIAQALRADSNRSRSNPGPCARLAGGMQNEMSRYLDFESLNRRNMVQTRNQQFSERYYEPSRMRSNSAESPRTPMVDENLKKFLRESGMDDESIRQWL